ncbi:MAG TPA: hypothetical protein EYP04_13545 [Anaerolineae bacterium]|nr:hypothetical protein [Anaerolineae bacterium]
MNQIVKKERFTTSVMILVAALVMLAQAGCALGVSSATATPVVADRLAVHQTPAGRLSALSQWRHPVPLRQWVAHRKTSRTTGYTSLAPTAAFAGHPAWGPVLWTLEALVSWEWLQ